MKHLLYLLSSLFLIHSTQSTTAQTCTANFEYELDGLTVTFTDLSTSDANISSWSWDFGDGIGSTSNDQNPVYTFSEADDYNICLTITTTDNCTDTFCLDDVEIFACKAAFTADLDGLNVDFTDQSFTTDGSTITSWSWDFDDGSTSNEQNPSHTFSEEDKYSVCLTITTSSGCTDELCADIEICQVNLSVSVNTNCNANNEVSVTITATDVFDNAKDIDILVDGVIQAGGPYEIDAQNPVTQTIQIAGDGLTHTVGVQSTDIGSCATTTTLTVPDCSADCFLSAMNVTYANPTTTNVQVGDDFFSPQSVTIEVGDIVHFDWIGSGHSTTSDATTGPDSWNSGVIDVGSTYDVQIQTPAVHNYYCIPHGGPNGVGMSGNIVANCPSNNQVTLTISFNTSIANPSGFNLYVDNVLDSGSPYFYSGTGANSITYTLTGDGASHTFRIEDINDNTCDIEKTFTAPDCGAAPACTLSLTATQTGGCNPSNEVPYELSITSINGGANGFNILVDGVANPSNPYTYDASNTTIVSINISGDAQNHTIEIEDALDNTCSASITITPPDCTAVCDLTNLLVTTGSVATHIVEVQDFVFSPVDISITLGDIVDFQWTGAVAHTTTSDAETGVDSWDSGLLNQGASFTVTPTTLGNHPYYCIPHGAAGGVGMAGTISVVADCNNSQVSATVTFDEANGGFGGFNILIDGVATADSPYTYDASGSNSVNILINGDGQSHSIEVEDVDNGTCSATTSITTVDCNFTPPCALTLTATQSGACDDLTNEVPIELTLTAENEGASGFNIFVDGIANSFNPYTYDASGTTTVTLNISGDGQSHTFEVQDVDDSTCSTTADVTVSDCFAVCDLTNLAISTGTVTTHIVEVQDFVFSPVDISITLGDIVDFQWTGQVAHTTTSDVATGADSWDSGLLNNGASFTVTPTTLGNHPYYCEPHGAAGGVGMAGTISVVADCNNSQVSATVTFDEANGGFGGFNILIDGVATADSPYAYDASGSNSINVLIAGDGQSHSIEVEDVDNGTCSATTSITTVDCNFTPPCALTLTATQSGACDDLTNEVPIELTITAENEGASGFNILVDGIANSSNPYTYDASGTTTVTLNISGDGQSHTFEVQDVDDTTCSATADVTVSDCFAVCDLTNLAISTGTVTTHVVEVQDFVFSPVDITITLGDIVDFQWTGAVAHTTTSDAETGADSWDSGLLNQGASFTVSPTTLGNHSYYCIPHGAAGGVGMAGTISVVADCNNSQVSATVTFDEANGGFGGFNILIDGVATADSPYTYDASGSNSVNVLIDGDGQSHTVEVQDVDSGTCSVSSSITTVDCSFTPPCELSLLAAATGGCDTNNDVPIQLTITAENEGANGFNVLVDGVLNSNQSYDVSGTTIVNLNISGDGQSHTIEVQDVDDTTCSAIANISLPNCFAVCDLSNLNISTGSSTTHIVEVQDFDFSPANITITLGDIVDFQWTGQVAHTTTSDAESGADSWDSGLLNNGASFQVTPTTLGNHPYYCEPHGAPNGVGMAGTISVVPDCNNNQVSATLTFEEVNGGFGGFNVLIDGIITADSPYTYDASSSNSVNVLIDGDGQSHTVEVQDVDSGTCSVSSSITTVDCSFTPPCELSLSAAATGGCDTNNNVPIELTVTAENEGANGFNVLVDGVLNSNQSYDASGTTTLTINLSGDGQSHTIEVQDVDDSTCSATASVSLPDCFAVCDLSNLNISTGSSTTHIVEVQDFDFSPANITITLGDIVDFQWTGQVAHTTTSDADTGADSWDSGLLNNGASFQVTPTTLGNHPYYCEPHGAPNGVGMAGTITVVPDCNNNQVSATVIFDEANGGFGGFNVLIDGTTTADSPYTYDASGSNSVNVLIDGDGQSHTVEVQDVDSGTCSVSSSITTVDCSFTPPCELSLSAAATGGCDTNNNVPIQLTITAENEGANGFNVLVDGVLNSNQSYDASGTTTVNLNILGDAQSHTIEVQDVDDSTCSATASVSLPDCFAVCDLSNLNISTGSSTTHIVEVQDFDFSPANITITLGDIVDFQWIGQVAHTTTSDAESGADSWDSGLLNNGASFQVTPTTLGNHPYYCEPHGAPNGVGMAGTISVVPDCNNNQVSATVTFEEANGGFGGFNVLIDGTATADSPYTYDASGSNSVNVLIDGDGQSHTVEVQDVDSGTCSVSASITTVDCSFTPPCELSLSAAATGGCDTNNNVPIELTIMAENEGANGFNVLVDGVINSSQSYDASGTTVVTLNLSGDGQSHTFEVQDVDDSTCSATADVTVSDCFAVCDLTNLAISTGTITTHVVEVQDFVFSPVDISITLGDIVDFQWTGAVAHTTTSDAETGADSWDSGLLNNGASFTVTPTTLGNHPYYCEPHGAAGGVGMAGTITVVPDCNNNQVSATLTFEEANGGFGGFNVLIDGTVTADSPYTYDASGSNSVNVLIDGDGQSHTVEVQDVDSGTCSVSASITTVDCSFTPPCELSLSAAATGGCDTNNNVPIELTIMAENEGANGFNVLVDGVINSSQSYDVSGTTVVTLNLSGDGQSHTIEVQDVDDSTCSATANVSLPNCFAVCDLSNLSLVTNEPQTHLVKVQDFEFVPKELTVNVGDTVRFDWMGIIPHTATSDATSGADVWDSGLLGEGASFDVVIQTAGEHPYYCVPHGAVGGIGMAGVITALSNCENDLVPVLVRFEVENGSFEGFNVLVDGTATAESPYAYGNSSLQEVSVQVAGDGMAHTIEVEDIADSFCSIGGNVTTVDCSPEPTCSLNIEATQVSDCDFDGQIEVELQIEGNEVGENGFNILVDGNVLVDSPFAYSDSGTTLQTISMVGTGTTRQIEVQDVDDADCRATTSIATPLCGEFCEVLNLEVATEEAVKYVVEVRDFDFFPRDIEVRIGDTVQFVWTGEIPHSTTSDVTSGVDSWNSGIIGEGSVFEVIIQTTGEHPYYCIPHGGPNGIGMAGTITALPKCNVNTANVVASFEVTNGSPNGYRAFLDGALLSETAFEYDNSVGLNRLNFSLLGDGETHILTVQDLDNQVCAASVTFEAPLCGSGGCEIVKLGAFTGQNVIHTVEVRDFDFFPKEIDVTVGETVRFVWTGVIPHTATSDATSGADVWDSGLLEEGAVYDVVIQTAGEHPYYCIPHGGPNGVGMAGVIRAVLPCENDEHTVQLGFEAINGSDLGFNVYVDGNLLPESPYPYDNANGANTQILQLEGDGMSHTITVQDAESAICADNAPVFLPQCGAACAISDVSANVADGKKHTVEVRDFDFFPQELEVNVDDVVEFVWTGEVPHTATSDATSGADVWDSGLLGQGASFEVVIQTVGEHGYYCIPHGAPNGIGMAGMIRASDPCEEGTLPVAVSFNAMGMGFNGFNVLVDAQLLEGSPFDYTAMGQNEVTIEVVADGETHLITIQDVDDLACQQSVEIEMPNCNDACLGFEAGFTFNVEVGSLSVAFSDASTVGADSWTWDFGDGNSSSMENPTHTFESEGSYEVCLTVEDSDLGCSDTFCTSIAVGEVVCEADFEFAIAEGLMVDFVDVSVSSDSIVAWNWSFGDGAVSDLPNPQHTFADLGVYTVCLEVVTEVCTNEMCIDVDLTDVCLLFETNFAFEVNHSDLSVQLFDLTQGAADTWLWGFGDGVTSNVQNPTHTYSQAGNYTVCLLARNTETDCFEPLCKVVTVGDMVGIEDLELRQLPLVIFPNPTSRSAVAWQIEGIYPSDFQKPLLLELYDFQGRLVYRSKVIGRERMEVRLEGGESLAEGLYLLRLEGKERRYLGKVVIQ